MVAFSFLGVVLALQAKASRVKRQTTGNDILQAIFLTIKFLRCEWDAYQWYEKEARGD